MGYYAKSRIEYEEEPFSLSIFVQGTNFNPHEMNQKIENFLYKFVEDLDELTEEKFNEIK